MELLRDWGPYAPLLLNAWFGLAALVAFWRDRQLAWLWRAAVPAILGLTIVLLGTGVAYSRGLFDLWFSYAMRIYFPLLLVLLPTTRWQYLTYKQMAAFLTFRPVGEVMSPTQPSQREPLRNTRVMVPVYALIALIVVLGVAGVSARTCGALDLLVRASGCTREVQFDANSAAFSADGKLFAAGKTRKEIKIWRVADWQELLTIPLGQRWLGEIAFSADSSLLATMSWYDNDIIVYRVADGAQVQRITTSHDKDHLQDFAFSPDGAFVAAGFYDANLIHLWRVDDGSEVANFTTGSALVAFTADSKMLIVRSEDHKSLELRSTDNPRQVVRRVDGGYGFTLAADGATIASFSNNNIELRRLDDGALIKAISVKELSGVDYTLSPHADSLILSSDESDDVREIRVADGALLHIWASGDLYYDQFGYSPDGHLLATIGLHSIRLWRTEQPGLQEPATRLTFAKEH